MAVEATVFWFLAPCSLADRYLHFEGIYCPFLPPICCALRMEVPGVSETLFEASWALWDAVLFPLDGLS